MASVEALSGPKPRRSRDDNRHSFQAAITAGTGMASLAPIAERDQDTICRIKF